MDEFFDIKKKEYIYIIGAGGKTSLMNYLLDFYLSRKKKCFITTTTKIGKNQITAPVVFDKEKIANGCCYVRSEILENKLTGFEPEYLDEIYNNSDYSIIVEADGAKMKPLKFPNINEPVVSKNASKIFLVLGLDSLNKKLSPDIFHRLDLFLETFPGFKTSGTITFEMFNKIIGVYYDKSPVKNFYLLLNKIDECKEDIETIKNKFKKFSFPSALSSFKEKKFERIK
ncbi:MAG TPA: selenium cofactor biosynthesis protein YqeC [bacterium]|nr:selenium cofactor biosynthesis protein YqeC [bacterium]HPN30224.1 selenium cofactor biosynthesis protein YqeC [bacterium]